jgi:pyridoxal phosphate enzyme (YggS family)
MAEQSEPAYETFLGERRARIMELVAGAARRSGRATDDVLVEAVSKTVDVPAVVDAIHVGYDTFGENRPQELTRKLAGLAPVPEAQPVRFDMIGNLQTNKINQVLGRVGLIHSVSSLHLAEAVSKRAVARDLVEPILLEINVSGEESKSGMSCDQATTSLDEVLALPGLSLQGLMTMAPRDEPDEARRTFSGLRGLVEDLRARSGLALPVLSCGMSDDFQIAIEEGSTLVRLGRVVFSEDYTFDADR